MRRRTCRFEAAALVDRDVDQYGALAHARNQFVAHERWRLRTDHQDGTNHDVRFKTRFFNGECGGRDGLHSTVEVNVDLTQALQVSVQDLHVGVQSRGHRRGGEPRHTGTDDDDVRWRDAGNARNQRAVSATGTHEVVRAHEGGHTAGNFAHRREQG